MIGLIIKNHFKNISKFGIGNFIYLILNFYIIKYLTTHYTTEKFGEYSLIVAFSSIVFILIQTITSAIGPFLKKGLFDEKELKTQFINLLVYINVIFLIVAFILFLLGRIYQVKYIDEIILSVFLGLSISINMVLNSFNLIKGLINRYLIFNLLNFILRAIIISSLIFLKIHISIFKIIQLFIISNFLTSIISIVQFDRKFKIEFSLFEINSKFFKKYIEYSKFILLGNIIGWSNNFFDKFILGKLQSTSLVGVYSLQYQYSFSILNQLSQTIGQFFNSIFWNKKYIENQQDKIFILIRNLTLLIIVCSFLIIMIPNGLIDFLIQIVSSKSFLGYNWSYKFILIGGLFYMGAQIIANPLFEIGKIKRLIQNQIVVCVIFLSSSIFLVSNYYLNGLAIALMGSNIFYYCLNIKSNIKNQ